MVSLHAKRRGSEVVRLCGVRFAGPQRPEGAACSPSRRPQRQFIVSASGRGKLECPGGLLGTAGALLARCWDAAGTPVGSLDARAALAQAAGRRPPTVRAPIAVVTLRAARCDTAHRRPPVSHHRVVGETEATSVEAPAASATHALYRKPALCSRDWPLCSAAAGGLIHPANRVRRRKMPSSEYAYIPPPPPPPAGARGRQPATPLQRRLVQLPTITTSLVAASHAPPSAASSTAIMSSPFTTYSPASALSPAVLARTNSPMAHRAPSGLPVAYNPQEWSRNGQVGGQFMVPRPPERPNALTGMERKRSPFPFLRTRTASKYLSCDIRLL